MKKILVIRFSSIGDIVLTSPVLRCLKLQLGSEVHFLTKKEFAPLVQSNPYLDKIWTIDDKVQEVTEVLKKENFDFVADLHHNLRSRQVKRALGKPSASLDKLNIKKWLLVNFKSKGMPDIHVAERCLQAVSSLGVKDDGNGLDFFIPPSEEVDTDSIPRLRKGYIGFVIGAQHATKRLPAEKILDICKKLDETIVLLGGKEDAAVAEKISRELPERVINACGQYSILQSASLVRQAKKIITHDTGLMHIAAAFKKEIISVWGNTVPAFGMYPYRSGHGEKGAGIIVEVKGLSCRPCTKIGFNKCPKGHFRCMKDIDDAQIVKAVKEPF
ncbi:MAG: glycosyltransferase family 9 protein [Bacteroidia bacterium]